MEAGDGCTVMIDGDGGTLRANFTVLGVAQVDVSYAVLDMKLWPHLDSFHLLGDPLIRMSLDSSVYSIGPNAKIIKHA